MAKQKTEETASTEVSAAAAATRAAIADRPRQSQVRLVEHYVTIRDSGVEGALDEFWSAAEQAELESNASKVRNPIADAVEKATREQVDRSLAALRNDDEKNGYANYAFDQTVFDEKTKEKTPRTRKSPVDKAAEALNAVVSEEDEAALLELFAARGYTIEKA